MKDWPARADISTQSAPGGSAGAPASAGRLPYRATTVRVSGLRAVKVSSTPTAGGAAYATPSGRRSLRHPEADATDGRARDVVGVDVDAARGRPRLHSDPHVPDAVRAIPTTQLLQHGYHDRRDGAGRTGQHPLRDHDRKRLAGRVARVPSRGATTGSPGSPAVTQYARPLLPSSA